MAIKWRNIKTNDLKGSDLDFFKSSEQTGDGGAQSVAHGLSRTPTLVMILPTESDGSGFDVDEGAHTSTNVIVTIDSGVKYIVFAM